MYGYVLQDWITVRGTTTTPLIQNESDWMGFSSFQDIVFWIDVREVTGTSLSLALQTSPTKDDALFQTLSNCLMTTVVVTTPWAPSNILPKAILASNPGVPLATWVRWSLTNSVAAAWDCTFRILASANRVSAG